MKVEVLSASDLPSADRNGYSDPYCKFRLNDVKVHETDKKKKTLNPIFNESFSVAVKSRTASTFLVEVWDWDFGDKDDFLGKAIIDLNTLEPFTRKEFDIPLDGKSGSLKLAMVFNPSYITRARHGDSTFHGTLTGVGKVASTPVKTVGKVGGAVGGVVGGGVIKTGSFLGKSFRRRKSRSGNDMEDGEETGSGGTPEGAETPPVPVLPSIETQSPEMSAHQRAASASRVSISGHSANGTAESGTASITMLSTSGFPPKANIRVHVILDSGKNPKEVHKTKAIKSSSGEVKFEGESFKVPCTADSPFRLLVKDHSTFGHDDELGEGHFFIADQGPGSDQVVRMTKGEGKVILRSVFQAMDSVSTAGSHAKLSRFGIGSKRDSRERSTTPGL